MRPLLVLCLGNDILSDDAFGPTIEKKLREKFQNDHAVEVVYASTAGFGLLDLLKSRSAVLVVDSIVTGADPGTIHFFQAGNLIPSYNLVNSHQINLPTALELGRKLGYKMPEDIQVLAVEAEDVKTLSEHLTPAVQQAVDEALGQVLDWIDTKIKAMPASRSHRSAS